MEPSTTLEANELRKLIKQTPFDASKENSNVRCYSKAPFCATYITAQQLETLKNLRSSTLTLRVFGAHLYKGPTDFKSTKILKHSVSACTKENAGSPISLCELVTRGDSVEAITMALKQFRDR